MSKVSFIYLTIVSSILLASCEKEEMAKIDTDVMVESDDVSTNRQTKQSEAEKIYIDLTSQTMDEKVIKRFMSDYFTQLSESIRLKSFPLVEPYLKDDSLLYNEQKLKIENFSKKDIKESIEQFQIVNWYEDTNHIFKIQTHETVTIEQPNQEPYTKVLDRLYTARYHNKKLTLEKAEPFEAEENKAQIEEPATTKTSSLNDYNGKWSIGNSNTKGLPVVEIYATSNSQATVKVHSYKPPHSIKSATVEKQNVTFKNNQALIEYESDSLGNQGSIMLTLKANSILVITQSNQSLKSDWSIPTGEFLLTMFEK
ncbi:hypothetical protein FZC66_09300 [Priestia megaterium]|nr:hypothetical protein FZC66_09300 [Priestia megaterium]